MVQYQQARFDASFAALSDVTRRGVLEQLGRSRTCRLGKRRLAEEAAWIERYRQLWAARFDALDEVLKELKQQENADGRRKK